MRIAQQFAAEGLEVTRQEYEDVVVLAADFGPAADAAADIVGDTIILVADGDQYEFEVGAETPPRVAIHNGVFTVEVDA
ncbi:MAG: hypothetical protein V5A43_07020 [Haloarculaceae archaeon]